MTKKIIVGAVAFCAAVCLTVTAFAVEPTDCYINNIAQVDGYQSVAYLSALDSLKKAEQEFVKQKTIADSEKSAIEPVSEDYIPTTNGGNLPDTMTEYDYSLIIGEFEPNSYWKALNDLKIADMNFKKVCADLGVESNYVGVLDSGGTRISTSDPVTSSVVEIAIQQVPQERYYWCGYAALKSMLDYEGIRMTQEEIATEIYDPNKSCPWFTVYGTEVDQYYIPKYLNEKLDYTYAPFSPQLNGYRELKASDIQDKIFHTLHAGHGVFVGGESYRDLDKEGSRLPGYPKTLTRHYIAISGGVTDGSAIYVVDPAKSSAVYFSGSISGYYSVSIEKLASYASGMGIVW